MSSASEKKKIATAVKSAKHWTKYYLEAINECIDEGDWEQAEYMAMQLAPLWGTIENEILEIRNRIDS